MNYATQVGKPTAHITKKKSRLKVYNGHSVFLNDKDNFEFEIHNPTNKTVLCKIKLNGEYISTGGIVLKPGQRVFLERFLDTNNKFEFSTYDVKDTSENRSAIDLNGDGVLDTGLVCATEHQGNPMQWYSGDNMITGAIATGLGSGASNTATIIEAQGEGIYAASVASAYRGGGFKDWFLPSKEELNLMYVNLKEKGLGGFSTESYWSASELTLNVAWDQSFLYGNQYGNNKISTRRVRPVRAF